MKEKENELVNAEIVDQDNILHLTKPLPSGQTEIYFDFTKLNGHDRTGLIDGIPGHRGRGGR